MHYSAQYTQTYDRGSTHRHRKKNKKKSEGGIQATTKLGSFLSRWSLG